MGIALALGFIVGAVLAALAGEKAGLPPGDSLFLEA
jgi:hypothetical protein